MVNDQTVSDPAAVDVDDGPIDRESPLYVERGIEPAFLRALQQEDCIVLLKGSQQVGKTSLVRSALRASEDAGRAVVTTDFGAQRYRDVDSLDALYHVLATDLADQLNLDIRPEDAWQDIWPPSTNFERYLRRVALRSLRSHLVWALDDADHLFDVEFSSDLFALIRSMHNERSRRPTGPWSRLTFLIAYAREAHLFIRDLDQSPFNVGTRFELPDFTFAEIDDLNERHGSPLRSEAEVARYARLVGGCPYLVQRGLREMGSGGASLTALESGDESTRVFGSHLDRLLGPLTHHDDLGEVIRTILRGDTPGDRTAFERLRSAGFLIGESRADARPRCQLYAAYFEDHFLLR